VFGWRRKPLALSECDAYVSAIPGRFIDVVRELDRVITTASPELEARVMRRMLAYLPAGDRRNWMCGISTSRKGVDLCFRYGRLLTDSQGVLEPGDDQQAMIAIAPSPTADERIIAMYVVEAVSRAGEFHRKTGGRS